MIYLPKEAGTHPTRSLHNGWNKVHSDYNKDIVKDLDDIFEMGQDKGWSKTEYAAQIDDLRKDTRKGLRAGKIKCH